MPGALVNAQVQSVLAGGLVLSFLTFFTGTVDQYHLAQVSSLDMQSSMDTKSSYLSGGH